jgi:acetyl esterase/lipase
MLDRWERNDAKRLAGKSLPTGVREINDIPYCGDGIKGHLLDIYYPDDHDGRLPVFIDLHGGGFMCSDKELNRLFGHYIAKKGFLVFNLNYRLAFSEAKVPDQIRDIATATHWIKENLERYCGDPEKVYISGHSGGGVLAIMEALTAKNRRLRELFQIRQSGFENYQGVAIDCGMMTFYENTIGYWGMRSMCFEKGYKNTDYYQSMIWDRVPEMNKLPRIYLISNAKDELRHMTLAFQSILERLKVDYKLNYKLDDQNKRALGHMAVIYDPFSEECSETIDDMIRYLLS